MIRDEVTFQRLKEQARLTLSSPRHEATDLEARMFLFGVKCAHAGRHPSDADLIALAEEAIGEAYRIKMLLQTLKMRQGNGAVDRILGIST